MELDYVTASVGLSLVACDIGEPMDLSWAALPRLDLTRSRLVGLQAVGSRVAGDLLLDGATVSGKGDTGAVRLRGAHVGAVLMDDAQVHHDSGPALFGDSLRVETTFTISARR